MDFDWVTIALGDVGWVSLAFALGFLARSVGLGETAGAAARLLIKSLWPTLRNCAGKNAELQSMADTLEDLAARCDGGSRPDCPILAEIQGIES